MKPSKTKLAAAILAAVGAGRNARGAIFSAIDLEQNIFYDQHGTGPQVATPVADQTVPFNSTVSLNTGTGGVISATYNIYDNGQMAGLSITKTATITAPANALSEGTQGDNYAPRETTFEFAEPVNFVLTISGSGTTFDVLV